MIEKNKTIKYNIEFHKSRKYYICDFSGNEIKKGELYVRLSIKTGKKMLSKSGFYYDEINIFKIDRKVFDSNSNEVLCKMFRKFIKIDSKTYARIVELKRR